MRKQHFQPMVDEVKSITPKVFQDPRGAFVEWYHEKRYRDVGVDVTFCQDNYSYSKKGVLRGMHFQEGQAKLVYCPSGRIFDVVVDIRRNSPTFGKWKGFYLDGENHKQLFIPSGFAHGFCVLSDEAHVIYKVSRFYDPMIESGFRYDDAFVGIEWPIVNPILSERDKSAPEMKEVV